MPSSSHGDRRRLASEPQDAAYQLKALAASKCFRYSVLPSWRQYRTRAWWRKQGTLLWMLRHHHRRRRRRRRRRGRRCVCAQTAGYKSCTNVATKWRNPRGTCVHESVPESSMCAENHCLWVYGDSSFAPVIRILIIFKRSHHHSDMGEAESIGLHVCEMNHNLNM